MVPTHGTVFLDAPAPRRIKTCGEHECFRSQLSGTLGALAILILITFHPFPCFTSQFFFSCSARLSQHSNKTSNTNKQTLFHQSETPQNIISPTLSITPINNRIQITTMLLHILPLLAASTAAVSALSLPRLLARPTPALDTFLSETGAALEMRGLTNSTSVLPSASVTVCTEEEFKGDCAVAVWPVNQCIDLMG